MEYTIGEDFSMGYPYVCIAPWASRLLSFCPKYEFIIHVCGVAHRAAVFSTAVLGVKSRMAMGSS